MEAARSVVMSSSSFSLSSSYVFTRFSLISTPYPYACGNGISISFQKCNSSPRRAIPIPLVVGDSPTGIGTSTLRNLLPKIDKSGRFCSPRAARELALMILYAACLQGSDPVSLFEKRLSARRESGYEFDIRCLVEYDHMSFGGPPVTAETTEEADEILRNDQRESDIAFSSQKLKFFQHLQRCFTRKLLVAVTEKWDSNVIAIDKVAPHNWKNEPAGRILEFSVLHLAMSEIAVLGTRHQIVINEAIDLAKRFCDGAAPRILNGCLRTYVRELEQNGEAQLPQNVKVKETV